MKYRYITILLINFALFLPNLAKTSGITDTIKSIPFIETWESGSFTSNGWTFPYMQGNWTILTNSGDPSPCAAFNGAPSQSNYINELRSVWFDATEFTCDNIYLDFDLKLQSNSNTGTERLRIIFGLVTANDTVFTVNNYGSFPWKHYHLRLYQAPGTLFKVKFLTFGPHSANFTAWSLDNIEITSKCVAPGGIEANTSGSCGSSSCSVHLTWKSPICHVFYDQPETIFYDDSTAENAVAINPGFTDWLGNKFPNENNYSGIITKFDVWFWYNPVHGSDLLKIDVFDENRNLVDSTEYFLPPDDAWVSVSANNIPFSETFYAMVKWSAVIQQTNWLGMDLDGPYVSLNLAYYYDGTTWSLFDPGCGNRCVFMIRAHALVSSSNKKSTPVDTTFLLGYNVYKADGFGATDFVKVNDALLTDTLYDDMINCWANYYVTAVYNNCVSDSSGHAGASCFVGTQEITSPVKLKLQPNPADRNLQITSDNFLESFVMTDLFGRTVISADNIHEKEINLDLSGLKNGIYLAIFQTRNGQTAEKVIVRH